MQSQTRNLGDTGTSLSRSSNMGSTLGRSSEGPASPLRSAATKRFSKELQMQATPNQGWPTSQLGQGEAGAGGLFKSRMTQLLTMDSSAMAKQLKKTKSQEKKERASKASNAKSLEARSMAIDAKCSPEAVWSACDTFWEFDTAHSGAITREGYINLMRECATVNTLRMLRRARLEFRFRRSAAPVLLEDFLLMIWPKATSEDRARMMRWAELRECFDIVKHNFGATDQDLERLYRLLSFRSKGGQVQVVASELGRARLLPKEVITTFARERHPKEVCFDYEDFKTIVWPKLKERWVSSDTIRKQKTLMEEKDSLRVRIQRQTEADHPG